jgi:hypothetical protein
LKNLSWIKTEYALSLQKSSLSPFSRADELAALTRERSGSGLKP